MVWLYYVFFFCSNEHRLCLVSNNLLTLLLISFVYGIFVDIVAAAVLSGNRNFEGRVHALTRANYLASPPLVVAYALAGTVISLIIVICC